MLIAIFVFVSVLALAIGGVLWALSRVPVPATQRVVSAVMTASTARDKMTAQTIESAMSQAVTDALARGVSIDDTRALKIAMQEARARVLRR
jgi:hypothetical protein